MSYWLDAKHRKRGLVTEAVAGVARLLLGDPQSGVIRLEIRTAVGHRASYAVAERLGFTREAVLRRRRVGDWQGDMMIYTLHADELAGSPAARATDLRADDATGAVLAAVAPRPPLARLATAIPQSAHIVETGESTFVARLRFRGDAGNLVTQDVRAMTAPHLVRPGVI